MFNHERHSGKLFITCVILFILMMSFFIAFLVEKNKSKNVTPECQPTEFTVCHTPECQASGTFINECINHSINPCDDFYEYACGNWLQKNPIPDSEGQFGMMSSIGFKINEKLKGLLNQPHLNTTTDATDKVKIFYKSCMHQDATVEKNTIKEMNELLAKLGEWPLIMDNWSDNGKWNWWEAVATVKSNIGIDVIMGTTVTPNFLDTSKYCLFFQMPSPDMIKVGLMSIPHLVLNSTAKAGPLTIYEQYMKETVCHFTNRTFCDSARILDEIREVVKLEADLKNVAQPYLQKYKIIPNGVVLGDTVFQSPNLRANGDDVSSYVMKVKDLQGKVNGVDWDNFIKIIFKEIPITNIAEMEVFASTEYLNLLIQKLSTYSKKTIASFIGWKALSNLMPYASASFRSKTFQYTRQVYGLKADQKPADYCVNLASTTMGFAVTNLYASKYMDSTDTDHAKKLITNIKGGFLQTLKENGWLDKTTKDQAINKLNKMEENVAFPPWNNDTKLVNDYYSNLGQLSETEFLKNAMSAMKVNFLKSFSKLTVPVNKKNDWPKENPMIQNAFYYTILNSFYLLAGIMDLPLISKNNLESLNHGGIGNIIAHEVMHGFDNKGSKFDEMGRIRNWWTPEAFSQYQKRASCMQKQYNSILEETTSIPIKGDLTLGENIADSGGIKGAYWGYKASVKNDIRLPGLESTSGDKLFFISAAQLWCTNTRKEAMKILLQTDTHAPAKYRVNIPFGNLMEFARVFNCPKNTKMNPNNKCVIF